MGPISAQSLCVEHNSKRRAVFSCTLHSTPCGCTSVTNTAASTCGRCPSYLLTRFDPTTTTWWSGRCKQMKRTL